LLVLAVEFFDPTGSAQFIVLAVVAVMINGLPLRPARICSFAAFGLYLGVNLAEAWVRQGQISSDEVVSSIYANLLFFVLVFGAFYMLKKQLLTNRRLEVALQTLRQQSVQLEQLGAVAERNRIAGEIHDTVGHRLTSAVIAIEAGEKLIDQDRPAALDKLHLTKDQVRRGLTDIRSSVRAIHSGTDQPFAPALDALVDEIRSNTDLAVQAIVDVQTDMLPIQQHVLLNAVKECATNSLKHGASTQADLLIQEFRGSIQLTWRDNGLGTDRIVYGFGLQNMSERVQSLGGTLTVNSSQGEGFVVSISIPTGLKKDGEP
jgi:signal transduction histidine kinase